MRVRVCGGALALVLLAGTATAAELCTGYGGLPAGEAPTAGMVWLDGGTFTMGSERQRPEERAEHEVTLEGFWIDAHEVTNAQFAAFVAATDYVTVAERGLDPQEHPNLPADLLAPGSMVFSPPAAVANYQDITQWWRYVQGASWREPLGPGSSIEGLDNHPVVHIAYQDAQAYARWAGKMLPSEAQWEYAARGGLEGKTYAWGDRYDPLEGFKANTWQGAFPADDSAEDGFNGTAPVGCYAPNGYGLYDMAGNVWEYAKDWYVPGHLPDPVSEPQGPNMMVAARFVPPGQTPSVVVKGGSWLCSPVYCARYRPSARQPQELSLGSNHIGFRTVSDAPPPGAS
ncbi:MAG: formylglycine-generating enzyme family protein [Geminicoccaceae bacterium]